MNVPGWDWHPLKGGLAGHWAAKVNGNWRLTFSLGAKMQSCNPPHPGLILKDTVLREDGGISVTELAKKLRMTRAGISRVVNGKAGINAELAVRLASLLNVSARSWLTMQAEYDLWQIRNKRRPKIRPLAAEGVQGGG